MVRGLLKGRQNRRRHERECSFCGKNEQQAFKLIMGPGVSICDECVELCNEIIVEERDQGRP